MSTSYGIVLIPNPDLSAMAIAVSELLQRFDSHFTLSTHGPFPHLSLYMIKLSSEALEVAIQILSDMVRSEAPLDLTAKCYSYVRGYVDIEYEKTSRLAELQARIIEATNHLRDQEQPAQLPHRDIEAENIRKYGYGLIGDLFRPHITFTKLQSDDHAVTDLLGDLDRFGGAFSQIGLFELAQHGTCVKLVATFEMKD